MKIAFFSDIHGNLRALESVLDDITRQSPDLVVCGGDIPNPLYASLETWRKIQSLHCPIIRGNHEDYIRAYFDPAEDHLVKHSVQFGPIQRVARHLGASVADEFSKLPLEYRVEGPLGHDVLFVHASKASNFKSFKTYTEDAIRGEIVRDPARCVVSGHLHRPWDERDNRQLRVVAGSVGIPMSGQLRPEWSLLIHRGQRWEVEHRTVRYDVDATLREFCESGMLRDGGPVAWLVYDEMRCAESRLPHFIPWALSCGARHDNAELWKKLAQEFLEKVGSWDKIRRLIA